MLTGQPDPVGAGSFAAAVAGIGMKDPRFFRQRNDRRLHRKQRLRLSSLQIGKGFLPGHAGGSWLQHQANTFPGFPVVEGIGRFSPHMEQQIPFSNAATL